MSDLIDFLKEVEPNPEMRLPFFHTCNFPEATEYVAAEKIFRKPCDVYNIDLVYLFLGKGRYMAKYINAALRFVPISFVLKPTIKIKIHQVYPFDTGALALDVYASVLNKNTIEQVKIEYGLGADVKIGYALIHYFFKSLTDYIRELPFTYSNQDIEETAIKSGAYQLQTINALYGSRFTASDGRRVTVEVQSEEDIDLTNNVDYLLVPSKPFCQNKKLNDFCIKNSVAPIFYAENYSLASDRYYGKLLDKAEEIALTYVV